MSVVSNVPPFKEFDPDAEDFVSWCERFSMHLERYNVKDPERIKHFIADMGPKLYAVLRTLASPKLPKDTSFDENIKLLIDYYEKETEGPPLKKRRVAETTMLDLTSRPRTLEFKKKMRNFVASPAYQNPEQLITEAAVEFVVLETDYLRLADGVGLLMLRNRIDNLEMKFMIGKLESDELKKALGLNEQDIKVIVQGIMSKIKQSDLLSGAVNRVVTKKILDFHRSSLAGGSTAQMKDPKLSDNVFEKASIHFLRWKYIFKFPKHPTVIKMKAFIEKSEIDEDVVCMEIAHLFVTLSSIGVHLPVMPNVGLESVLRSLELYSLNENPTVITVKSLYCDLFDVDVDK